jgi:hypothetical protein
LKRRENPEKRSDSALLYVARVLFFALLVLFALSWLIAPDLIATERNRLVSLVNLRAERPSAVFSVSVPVPASDSHHAPSALRPIASSNIDRPTLH